MFMSWMNGVSVDSQGHGFQKTARLCFVLADLTSMDSAWKVVQNEKIDLRE